MFLVKHGLCFNATQRKHDKIQALYDFVNIVICTIFL